MDSLSLPYQRHVLDNGLTVLLHQDRKAPHVAVNVWYRVGSKNERPGKTGLAHLFEHLMFEGSQHHDGEYFAPLEDVGATQINGTTSRDRTNYFQTVPVHALDLALWLESDRMGFFLEAFTEDKLEEQRSVVLNEMRQGYNQPYGKLWKTIAETTYPAGHPYSWPVIGYEVDVENVTFDDAHEWFRTYYGPTNAIVSLAGDLDFDNALERVERYFGAISPGDPTVEPGPWFARRNETRHLTQQDRVPQPRLTLVWNIPDVTDPDFLPLHYAANVISAGRSAVLFRRLVHQDELVTDIDAAIRSGVLGSNFVVQADARPGVELDRVHAAVEEELTQIARDSIDPAQLERAQAQIRARLLTQMQRVGGLSGKANTLASGEAIFARPDAVIEQLERGLGLTASDLNAAFRRWVADEERLLGALRVDTVPFGEPKSVDPAPDLGRSTPPKLTTPKIAARPPITTRQLNNGAQLFHLHRPDLPLVRVEINLPGGFASDSEAIAGTARMTAAALPEGTSRHDAFAISDRIRSLGARLSVGAHLDSTSIAITTLPEKLQDILEVTSELVADATFPEHNIERLREELRADIAQEEATPGHLAQRVLPRLLFGQGHPYAAPLTGSGSEAELDTIDQSALRQHRDTWYLGNQAKVAAAGSFDVDEIARYLEATLGAWPAASPQPPAVTSTAQPQPGIAFIERAGSEQSSIFGGLLAPPIDPDLTAYLQIFNAAFGGTFTSRINSNLREDKAWTYGAHSTLVPTRGQRPFLLYTEVDRAHTVDALRELELELEAVHGNRPLSDQELERVRSNLLLSLPATWETLAGATNVMGDLLVYDLEVATLDTYVERLQSATVGQVMAAVEPWLIPEQMIWVVVGNAEAGEALAEAFDIRRIGTDGKPS